MVGERRRGGGGEKEGKGGVVCVVARFCSEISCIDRLYLIKGRFCSACNWGFSSLVGRVQFGGIILITKAPTYHTAALLACMPHRHCDTLPNFFSRTSSFFVQGYGRESFGQNHKLQSSTNKCKRLQISKQTPAHKQTEAEILISFHSCHVARQPRRTQITPKQNPSKPALNNNNVNKQRSSTKTNRQPKALNPTAQEPSTRVNSSGSSRGNKLQVVGNILQKGLAGSIGDISLGGNEVDHLRLVLGAESFELRAREHGGRVVRLNAGDVRLGRVELGVKAD